MTLSELKRVIPTWQSVKLVGFETLDHEEYEITRYDGNKFLPSTFNGLGIVEIDTVNECGDTFLKVRVSTNETIDKLVWTAYWEHEFSTVEIRDQDGDLVHSEPIPTVGTVGWEYRRHLDDKMFHRYFEAVRAVDDTLEFTIYREEK